MLASYQSETFSAAGLTGNSTLLTRQFSSTILRVSLLFPFFLSIKLPGCSSFRLPLSTPRESMAGYGTTASPPPANGHARNHGSDPERQPLLAKASLPGAGSIAKVRRSLGANVSRSRADLMLLFCYVVTGLLDSASTQVWGAFVSMQTGKLHLAPFDWRNAAMRFFFLLLFF